MLQRQVEIFAEPFFSGDKINQAVAYPGRVGIEDRSQKKSGMARRIWLISSLGAVCSAAVGAVGGGIWAMRLISRGAAVR